MRSVLSGLAVLGLLLVGTPSSEAETVYNNAADFSGTMNPSGAWTYGYLAAESSPDSSTFTGFATQGTVAGSTGSIEYWNISGGGLSPPEIFYNTSSTVNSYSTITMQPHQAAFHPGPNDQYADYRFTAPQSGTYALSVTFTGIDVDGTTTDVHVLENGVSLFAGNINGYGATQTYSTILTLGSGGIVDFAVGFGLNGNYFNDSTGIDATLTSVVPEPASVVLLGLGSLSLLWGRSRRGTKK
jgi:hypothetical protein